MLTDNAFYRLNNAEVLYFALFSQRYLRSPEGINLLCIAVKRVRKKEDPGIDRMMCLSDYIQSMIANETYNVYSY